MLSHRLRRLSAAPLIGVTALALIVAAGLPTSARAAAGLTLTTPFPGVTASPDSRVSFDLSVDATEVARVNLEVTRVPTGWTASLHSGSLVPAAVLLDGKDPQKLRLDVDVPADATGTNRIIVVASDASSRVELPLDIRVEAQAGGEVTLSANIPSLRGAAGTTFTFNVTIKNDKSEDLTYTATGQAPAGWTVNVTPSGQTQAVSATVTAGAEAGLTATVKPPADVPAGTYDITVVATVGTEQIEQKLTVEITGTFELELSTASGALNAHGPSGGETEQKLTITNTGTADITNVTVTDTSPTGWDVTFEPETIPSIAAGETVDVSAKIKPSSAAIAGDYLLTFRAKGDDVETSAQIRFTVETSILGAIIGGALILVAIAGLLWVFRRYGRR